MEFKVENGDGIDSWKEVTLIYSAALRQMETKMQILNDEFQHVHQYNPIEHIKARIKTPESIVKKLKRYGQESTIDNMVKYINDIAGIRIICSFTSDIYRIADMIRDQKDIQVIAVKDYITYPKASGYKSYHMIVSIPVYLSDRTVDTKGFSFPLRSNSPYFQLWHAELSDGNFDVPAAAPAKPLPAGNVHTAPDLHAVSAILPVILAAW